MSFGGLNTLFKAAAAAISFPLQQVAAYITHADFFYRTDMPIIIAHRGTYGFYPEHAIAGYVEAYYNGADFLEFDVMMTKDADLVILHDPYLDDTTNIRLHQDRFWDRSWYFGRSYVPDFTLAELKSLRLTQKYWWRPQNLNDRYVLLTFQDVIDVVRLLNNEFPRINNRERRMGFYIELKDYMWMIDHSGMDMCEVMHRILDDNNIGDLASSSKDIPIVV